MRISPAEYRAVPLRAHALLTDVPLHDVWRVDLPGGPPEIGLLELRALLSVERLAETNLAVRALFGLRQLLGRLFGWDDAPRAAPKASYLHRLTEADRAASLVEPGTPDGPFHALFVSEREAISEVHNSTVHAFSVFALVRAEERASAAGRSDESKPPGDEPGNPAAADYRLYWAIYVRPVGRITAPYMALIDPFRRWIIYPAVLRRVRRIWLRDVAGPRAAR